MEYFINDKIDTTTLPKFEEVKLSPLHHLYKKVIWFNIIVTFLIIALIAGAAIVFIEKTIDYWMYITIGYIVALVLSIAISFISFRNKGFAFRTHDVIYRSGAIAVTTTIIPYNRVQHAAMHEGFMSRNLGLATVEIFTAGGEGSDIKIPGIEKEHAESIKQLLMGKVQKKERNE